MWDTTTGASGTLSHDMLCQRCGHAVHTFLECSDTCSCVPAEMPGGVPEPAADPLPQLVLH